MSSCAKHERALAEAEEQFDQFSEQLIESFQETSILQEVSEALGQMLDRDTIAQTALATALRMARASRGGFYAWSEYGWERLAAEGNLAEQLPPDWPSPLEARKKPLIENSSYVASLPGTCCVAPGYSNLLVAPLVGQEKMVGILAIFDTGEKGFDSTAAKMIQAIAKQAATALNNEEHHRQLLHAQEELLDSQKLAAMGELAAEIGHELNNYLMSMLGQVEIAQALMETNTTDGLDDRLRSVVSQVDKMTVLTKGLLKCSRKEIRPRKCRLSDILNEAVAFVQPQNRFDCTRFDLSLPDDLPTVCWDPNQMQQVFLNLFANAADAMGGASGTITISARHGADPGWIEVQISDEGPGVPPELRRRIFEPRFTTKSKGNGFGLAVCFRIIEAHGGTIRLDHSPTPGATFSMTLPCTAQALPPVATTDEDDVDSEFSS